VVFTAEHCRRRSIGSGACCAKRSATRSPTPIACERRNVASPTVERALCVFCDRELGYALRRRCAEPNCGLVSVETGRPRLSSNAFDLTLELYAADTADNRPIELRLCIYLEEPDLFLKVEVSGPKEELGAPCWALVRSDLEVFSGRAGIRQAPSAV